jgi:HK97 family phage major capsid protein
MNPEIIKNLRESGVPQRIAKSMSLTHNLARNGSFNLDSVIKAMDSQTAGEGKEWINSGFSPDIIQQVTLERKVTPLFRRFKMPSNPFKFPVAGGPPKAYLIPENTANTGQTGIPASDAGTAELLLSAKKLAGKVVFSDELSQDAFTSVQDYVQEGLLGALVSGEEDAIINGDITGTHMDADVTSALDARKAWSGLRKRAKDASATVDLGTMSTANLRKLRAKMGKYGVNPAKLAYITSVAGYNAMLNTGDLMTWEKMGPHANLINGEMAKFDGSPVIISEYVRTDLEASGYYETAGSPTHNKTEILLVYIPAFIMGDRLEVTLEDDRYVDFGQDVLVARERVDFQPFYGTTQPTVAAGINVAT